MHNWHFASDLSEIGAEAATLCWQDPTGPLRIFRMGEAPAYSYLLRFDPHLAVRVRPGPEIAVSADGVPQHTVDHFLADQVLPRIADQQGALVLHAGAVRVGEDAVLLLGPSGSGKSTLCASFAGSGARLLGDDATIIRWEAGQASALPVYPSLRLLPDTIAALLPKDVLTADVAHYSSKQRIEVPRTAEEAARSAPVGIILKLSPAPADSPIEMRRMSQRETCMAVIENSFALDPTDLSRARGRLEDAGRLASQVRAWELACPRDYARLPDVRRTILDQLACKAA